MEIHLNGAELPFSDCYLIAERPLPVLTKITKRQVDAATAGDRDLFLWDNEVKGFGLKITPQGRKVYLVQYRINGGPTRRYTIGMHGAPWTPDAARNRAKELLGLVAKGEDPSASRRAAKADISISQLCDLYLKEGVRVKKASTIEMDRSRIERHVKPLLGRHRLKSISRPDIELFLMDIAEGKTAANVKTRVRGRAIVKGGRGVANRVQEMLGAIFQFALDRGLRPDNPVRGIKKNKPRKFERFLSNEEMVRLGEALRGAQAEGLNRYAIDAIRLLLLTGCRKGEILKLRWEEVDLAGGFLRLADSKTGPKNVYLANSASDLIRKIPRVERNPYVFPGHDTKGRAEKEGHLVGLQRMWLKVRAKAGLEGVRLHDLRHSFASVGARSGESLLILGKVLGHATTSATARYAHLSDDPVRSANERIASEIAERMSLSTS